MEVSLFVGGRRRRFRRLRAAASAGGFRALRSTASATRRWTRAAFWKRRAKTLKKGGLKSVRRRDGRFCAFKCMRCGITQ